MKHIGPFWRGARFGLLFFLCALSGYGFYHFQTGLPQGMMSIAGMVLGFFLFYLLEWSWKHAKTWLDHLPKKVFGMMAAVLFGSLILHLTVIRLPDEPYYLTILFGAIAEILLFGGIYAIFKNGKFTRFYLLAALLGLVLNFAGLYFWSNEGWNPGKPFDPYPGTAAFLPAFGDPELPGNQAFIHFSYGSQNSTRRAVYNEDVRIATPTVDGSLVLPEWKGGKAKWRKRFWGFGIDSLPLNGLVWMPKGEGPFPVIFFLHGNHGMEDYSDPGYAYLGEHLATRGFIAVSVDENFLNATWSGDFRGREMPARAWLLLKHLEVWRKWADDLEPMKGKLDMERILLVGHSRGGEAVAMAAAYNQLTHFPDNALVPFDFDFRIRGLVTIAPTDKRYFRRMHVHDVDYLTIQGSHDSDEASLFGKRIGDRMTYSDSAEFINASVLIHRANHGQFNTGWGRFDFGKPFGLLLNTAALIPAADQQQAAKALITSFAEGVLHDRQEYRDAFREFGKLAACMPPGVYVTTFRGSGERLVADYESGLHLDRTDRMPGRIEAPGLTVWRNERLRYRDTDFQGNHAVVVGWDHQDTTVRHAGAPEYRIMLDPPFIAAGKLEYLRLDIATGDKRELEKEPGKTADPAEQDPVNLDFTVTCRDTSGLVHTAKFSDVGEMPPGLTVRFLKSKRLTRKVVGEEWEPAFQSCYLPLQAFEPPVGRAHVIDQISFAFDQSPKGILLLDRIGFAE